MNGQSGLCIGDKCCTQWDGCFQVPFKRVSKTCTASVNSCGVNIALVMDSSGSIDAASLLKMKEAFNGFVDTLSVTPSEFSVVEFSGYAMVHQNFTADTESIKKAIAKAGIRGTTNWQDAFIKAQDTFRLLDSKRKNLVVFASDGNPNTCGNSSIPGDILKCTESRALVLAKEEASKIKGSGTQIIALGLGNQLTPANMRAIASPDSYYPVENYDQLAAVFKGIATELCGGTINVQKIIDADGDLGTVNDQIDADNIELASWLFSVAGQPNKGTDNNGRTDSVCVVSAQGPFTVSEQSVRLKSDYNFAGAKCAGSSKSNGNLSMHSRRITNIQVGNKDIVSCTFYNSPIPACMASSTISCSADFKCNCPSGTKCYQDKCCAPACAVGACGKSSEDGCDGKIDCTQNCSADENATKISVASHPARQVFAVRRPMTVAAA